MPRATRVIYFLFLVLFSFSLSLSFSFSLSFTFLKKKKKGVWGKRKKHFLHIKTFALAHCRISLLRSKQFLPRPTVSRRFTPSLFTRCAVFTPLHIELSRSFYRFYWHSASCGLKQKNRGVFPPLPLVFGILFRVIPWLLFPAPPVFLHLTPCSLPRYPPRWIRIFSAWARCRWDARTPTYRRPNRI